MLLGSPSQCHAGLRVNIMQAIRFLVTSNRTWRTVTDGWVALRFRLHTKTHAHAVTHLTMPLLYYWHRLLPSLSVLSDIFFSFIYSFQCNVKWVPVFELNLTLAPMSHMQVDLRLRATDGAPAGSTEASSRRWRSHTRTHQNTNPVSHASLASTRCISTCHTVTMPDVSSTGEEKIVISTPLPRQVCHR